MQLNSYVQVYFSSFIIATKLNCQNVHYQAVDFCQAIAFTAFVRYMFQDARISDTTMFFLTTEIDQFSVECLRALSICMKKPVGIFRQVEQNNFRTLEWQNQLFRWGIKCNGSFHLQFWKVNRVFYQGVWYYRAEANGTVIFL